MDDSPETAFARLADALGAAHEVVAPAIAHEPQARIRLRLDADTGGVSLFYFTPSIFRYLPSAHAQLSAQKAYPGIRSRIADAFDATNIALRGLGVDAAGYDAVFDGRRKALSLTSLRLDAAEIVDRPISPSFALKRARAWVAIRDCIVKAVSERTGGATDDKPNIGWRVRFHPKLDKKDYEVTARSPAEACLLAAALARLPKLANAPAADALKIDPAEWAPTHVELFLKRSPSDTARAMKKIISV